MARLQYFLRLCSVFVILLVPVLVKGQDRKSPGFHSPAHTKRNGLSHPFYSSFEGTLEQKRDELIKRFLVPELNVIKRARCASMLSQTYKYEKGLASRIKIEFQEDRPTKDHSATLREYLSLLSDDMMDPQHNLFTSLAHSDSGSASSSTVAQNNRFPHDITHAAIFKPHSDSRMSVSREEKLAHIGRMMGIAILNKHFMDVSFMPLFYKIWLNLQVELPDIKFVEPDLTRELETVINTDLSVSDMNLKLPRDGIIETVTNSNKAEYIDYKVQSYVTDVIRPSVNVLLNGLYEVIPQDAFAMFDESELDALVSGEQRIDLAEWQTYTRVSTMAKLFNWKVITWFWTCVNKMDMNMRSRLLLFVTGTSRLPIGGFKGARSCTSAWFNIEYVFGKKDKIPTSDPYKNVIYLPSYSSYETFKDRLERTLLDKGSVRTWYASATELRYKSPKRSSCSFYK